jgi:hypothetical protein
MSFYGSSFEQEMRTIDHQLSIAFGKTSSYDDNRQRNLIQTQQINILMSSISTSNGYTSSRSSNSSNSSCSFSGSYWSSTGIF